MFNRITSIISIIQEDPIGGSIYVVSMMVAILISLILHECAHGYMALRCGDPTAKMLGRLSLNPAKHLDPVGTICMLVFGIGWAKPVPVNPRNFRDYRRDDFMVSIAGITMNLTLFLLSTALLAGANHMVQNMILTEYRYIHTVTDEMILGYIYNSSEPLFYVYEFVTMLSSINLSLALFNLLPIPPLDGYHLVNDLLLKGRFQLSREQFHIAQIVLIMLCMSGMLSNILMVAHTTVSEAVMNVFMMLIP